MHLNVEKCTNVKYESLCMHTDISAYAFTFFFPCVCVHVLCLTSSYISFHIFHSHIFILFKCPTPSHCLLHPRVQSTTLWTSHSSTYSNLALLALFL